MSGLPATNNPKQAGGTAQDVSRANNYAIFLANRVIITPSLIFAKRKIGDENNKTPTYEGNFSVSRSVDRGENEGSLFVILNVGLKNQVLKPENVDFTIPVM